MKYAEAKVLIDKINNFKEDIKKIDIEKADKKWNGLYTKALKELDNVLNNKIELEEIQHPDNVLRNAIILSHFDKTDLSFNK